MVGLENMASSFAVFFLLLPIFSEINAQFSSNVYSIDVSNRLQTSIATSGCGGGICVCSELNREWSAVLSCGVPLSPILAVTTTTNVDQTQEKMRAERQFNRILDSMPYVGRVLDTCKWSRTLFSERYRKLLLKMEEQTTNDSRVEAVNVAICELNEPVPDPEPVGDVTEVPLFTLYLRYKQQYFAAKKEKQRQELAQREELTDAEFQQWYQDNLELLRCDVDSAYQKWEIFGNKRKVEGLLMENDIVPDSSEITNALSVFNSVRDLQIPTANVAEGLMPTSLSPSGWQQILQGRLVY